METQHYELLYIVPIKFLDDELQKIVANINGLINKLNGTITLEDNLGKLRLAYPIKNVHQGSYVVAEFDMGPENEKKLNSQLSVTPEVLRHMLVKKRLKSEQEIKREQRIQDGMRKEKETELSAIQAREKTAVTKAEEQPIAERKEKAPDKRASLEDLDKKLDEILTDDIL